MDVGSDPSLQLFTPASLGVGVVAGSQYGHEQGSFLHRVLLAIVKRDFVTRPVDEQLLARTMLLAHNQVLLPLPAFVVIAETTIGIPLGMRGPVLFPQQLQGGVLILLQLLV